MKRLAGELPALAELIDQVLELAAALERGTIDQILRKSDLQVGREALLGLIPPGRCHCRSSRGWA